MSAYGATAALTDYVQMLLRDLGPWFPPPSRNLLESAYKQLSSAREFLSRLDGGSREAMRPSLRRFEVAVTEFFHVLSQHIKDQYHSQKAKAVEARSLVTVEMESKEKEFHAFFEVIRKMKKEECFRGGKRKSSDLIGLSEVYSKLKNDILNLPWLDKIVFLSIVGTAGIGKTALAEGIFRDPDVSELFKHRVWVSVGKQCRPEEIPRRILAQLDPDVARELGGGNDDVARRIEGILKGEDYLIVLDDVWDAEVCGLLESLLSNNKNGCRIIFTSRSRRLVKEAKYLTEMRLLNEKESWILLREKLFGGDHCSPDLEKVGKKIAVKCDGLPLTIVTIANLLSKLPESEWIDVAMQRKHQVFTDAYDEISKVLYSSYEEIPPQLKLCFLYMAVFPPNTKIARSRLTNMWFVEGLLESDTAKSSAECADEYLEEFFANSLIMVYQSKSISSMLIKKPKSCGLHTSWWHLCYTEARKTNFFYVLISYEDRLKKDMKSQSRLSIHNNVLFAIVDVYDSMEKYSASTACSLLCLGPYHRYPVPICFGMRFLKTLDALNIRVYEFPLEVLKLGGLKYFALTCDGELPHSISKLQNLQFFIVLRHHSIRLLGAPSYLPIEIWDMEELKHFQISGSDLPDDMGSTILPNLSTLLDVSDRSCTKSIFERIPHLKKLGIKIELSLDDAEPSYCFDHISQLNELEILKCVVVDPIQHKFEFVSPPTSLSSFPLGLKKLTLSGLGYPWKEMSKIASLPCLEVLKLRCNAFQGSKWEVEENGFTKLKFLEMEDINLMQWRIQCGSFEELEFISIKHCYKLKEFHWERNQLPNLEKIEVVDSNPLLETKVQEDLMKQGHYLRDLISVKSSWEAENRMD